MNDLLKPVSILLFLQFLTWQVNAQNLDLDPVLVGLAEHAKSDIKFYKNLISFIENKSGDSGKYDALLAPLSEGYFLEKLGIKLRCFFSAEDQLSSQEEFIYHGTRATLEILKDGQLRAYKAVSGERGIYFGQKFERSIPYFSDESSNIHETWGNDLVRSCLIFDKGKKGFYFNDNCRIPGAYLLSRESYSTDFLKAVVFANEKDAELYQDKFAVINNNNNNNPSEEVQFFIYNFNPLKNSRNYEKLLKELSTYQEDLLKDPIFIEFIFLQFPLKKMSLESAQMLLKNSPSQSRLNFLKRALIFRKKEEFVAGIIDLVDVSALLESAKSDRNGTVLFVLFKRNMSVILDKVLKQISLDPILMNKAATIMASEVKNYWFEEAGRHMYIALLKSVHDNFKSFPEVIKKVRCGLEFLPENEENFLADVLETKELESENLGDNRVN